MNLDIFAISDTHNEHENLIVPNCDILICAGDFTKQGRVSEVQTFLDWFAKQPAKKKVLVGGNHDFLLEREPAMFLEMVRRYPDIVYLNNTAEDVLGVKIFGSPHTPWFYNWAFNFPENEKEYEETAQRIWGLMPEGTDIVVTHGPAYKMQDVTRSGEHVGCRYLLNRCVEVKPKAVIFGHIHEDYGMTEFMDTKYYNVSSCNFKYKIARQPTKIEI